MTDMGRSGAVIRVANRRIKCGDWIRGRPLDNRGKWSRRGGSRYSRRSGGRSTRRRSGGDRGGSSGDESRRGGRRYLNDRRGNNIGGLELRKGVGLDAGKRSAQIGRDTLEGVRDLD